MKEQNKQTKISHRKIPGPN